MSPKRTIATICCCLLTLCAAGCSAPSLVSPDPQLDARRPYTVFVVRREWHTGIAVAAADWPDRKWPLLTEFASARYLEFGWGDAEYYQARKKTLRMTFAAVLWPTPSVMEVLGTADISMRGSSDYQVATLRLSSDQMRTLAASVQASFADRDPKATSAMIATTEGRVRFYRARGKFHFFRMCNRWTTDRLQAVGCSIRPWPVVTAARALAETRRCEERALTPTASDSAGSGGERSPGIPRSW